MAVVAKKGSEVYCVVTGHRNGPPCTVCGEKMDSVTVEEDKFGLARGSKGHVCFGCLAKR